MTERPTHLPIEMLRIEKPYCIYRGALFPDGHDEIPTISFYHTPPILGAFVNDQRLVQVEDGELG